MIDNQVVDRIWEYYQDKSTAFFRGIEISVVKSRVKTEDYSSVLDIGPGDGFLSRVVFDGHQYIVGIDNDEAGMSEIGLEKKFIDELHVADATEDWGFSQDRKYDVVFSNSVLEHIPEVEKVIERCGELDYQHDVIFTVPNHNFTANLTKGLMDAIPIIGTVARLLSQRRAKMLNHYNDNAPEWWISRFEKKGYRLVDSTSYLTVRQLQRWNLNAVLHRLFSVNILRREDVILEKEGDTDNSCTLFIFRKVI